MFQDPRGLFSTIVSFLFYNVQCWNGFWMANCVINKEESKIKHFYLLFPNIEAPCVLRIMFCHADWFHRDVLSHKQRGVCVCFTSSCSLYFRGGRMGEANTWFPTLKRKIWPITNPEPEKRCVRIIHEWLSPTFLSWHLFSMPEAGGVLPSQTSNLTTPWLTFSGCHRQSHLRKPSKRLCRPLG